MLGRVLADLRRDDGALDLEDARRIRNYFRHLIRAAVTEHFDALHFFFDEENKCVRICFVRIGAQSDTWFEAVPFNETAGTAALRALRRLRRLLWSVKAPRSVAIILPNGSKQRVTIESPHAWDVRLYLTAKRPRTLPYYLVFAGERRHAEVSQPEST